MQLKYVICVFEGVNVTTDGLHLATSKQTH
jgi:hypothetical protein